MSDGRKDFLKKVKYHLDLHHKLNLTLTLGELHPEGSEVENFPGADYFLNKFITIYKDN